MTDNLKRLLSVAESKVKEAQELEKELEKKALEAEFIEKFKHVSNKVISPAMELVSHRYDDVNKRTVKCCQLNYDKKYQLLVHDREILSISANPQKGKIDVEARYIFAGEGKTRSESFPIEEFQESLVAMKIVRALSQRGAPLFCEMSKKVQ
ncbi:hypothetical protein [Enterovibrio coralii]|uniref:Uncharacterized protein n=1 Tax=Enterovibrio coralii TaxID=294935 RepID=A0A135I479_9GAMM|nr:hypothetical protein [Enterovibrio coralii]KXF80243.1 hypothetical protein ATN88_10370 [Enterovibrio coralii]